MTERQFGFLIEDYIKHPLGVCHTEWFKEIEIL